MAGLPGWESLESVSRWVTVYEIAMIVCLAALVGAEVLHFNYSHRKGALIKIREQQQADNTKRDQDEAEASRKAEVDRLQNQLANAGKKVADLEAKQPQRRLTQLEKDTLIAAMRPFPNQKISIGCILGDIYGKELAEDFVQVAHAANWNDGGGSGFSQELFTQDPEGVLVFINSAEADAHRATAGIAAFVRSLADLHLIPTPAVTGHPSVAAETIRVLIGKKPNQPSTR